MDQPFPAEVTAEEAEYEERGAVEAGREGSRVKEGTHLLVPAFICS